MIGTVLIVEDDPICRGMWEQMLRRAGQRTVAVSSLAAAQTAVAGNPNELSAVVLDLYLPDSAGVDTVRVARAWGLPIVVVSGAASARELLHSRAEGADVAIEKGGVTAMQLVKAVELAVERAQARAVMETLRTMEMRLQSLETHVVALVESLLGKVDKP